MKTKEKKKRLLFFEFSKIGAFTFGGGYAMIPLIKDKIVKKRKWVSEQELLDIITVSETTPGPIAINVSTYVGYKVAGFLGALYATLGTIIAPIFVVIILSTIFQNLQNNIVFQNALLGIRAGAIALIIKVLLDMYKKCYKNLYSYITILISLILLSVFKINSIYIILSYILINLIVYFIKTRKEKI